MCQTPSHHNKDSNLGKGEEKTHIPPTKRHWNNILIQRYELFSFFVLKWRFPSFLFFFPGSEGNRNNSFPFTAQWIAVGFDRKRSARLLGRHHWSNCSVIMCLSACAKLKGRLPSWEWQGNHPSDAVCWQVLTCNPYQECLPGTVIFNCSQGTSYQ